MLEFLLGFLYIWRNLTLDRCIFCWKGVCVWLLCQALLAEPGMPESPAGVRALLFLLHTHLSLLRSSDRLHVEVTRTKRQNRDGFDWTLLTLEVRLHEYSCCMLDSSAAVLGGFLLPRFSSQWKQPKTTHTHAYTHTVCHHKLTDNRLWSEHRHWVPDNEAMTSDKKFCFFLSNRRKVLRIQNMNR